MKELLDRYEATVIQNAQLREQAQRDQETINDLSWEIRNLHEQLNAQADCVREYSSPSQEYKAPSKTLGDMIREKLMQNVRETYANESAYNNGDYDD